MDYILFDDLEDELPLVGPDWFRVETEYGYDPVTQARNPDITPVAEFWVSFLANTDQFELIKNKLLAQYNLYINDDEVTRLPITIHQDQTYNVHDGQYDVFWQLDPEWFTRLGSNEFEVKLHGYGEPIGNLGAILPNQVFTISESVSIGTIIGIVQGFNDKATIQSNPNLPFSYDPKTGTLAVSKKLDYEKESEYSITIGSTTVVVYVLDEIETPKYDRTDYVFYTQSSISPGSVIGSVTAIIQGESGLTPNYSIVSGNDNNNFAIDPVTGDLVVLNMAGILDNHVVGINDGHNTSLSCTLRILDDPIFSSYRFSIDESVSNGAIVGQIVEPGYNLSYTDSIFELQGDNLVIVNNQELKSGTYELNINTGTNNTLSVFVYVSTLSSNREFWLAADSSNGSLVGNPELNYDYYSIAPNNVFDINSVTGDIHVIASSLLTPSTYTVTVSNSNKQSTTSISIVVYAVSTEADFEFSIAPSAPLNTIVGNIGGVSPYTLTSGSFGDFALLSSGDISVDSSPVSATQFTVTDSENSEITIVITLTDTSEDGFVGIVLPGQEGQSVVNTPNVLYSIGPVGFGQGTLQITPDNTQPASRTLAKSVVFSIPTSLTYTFNVSGNVTQDMLNEIVKLYTNTSTTKVSVPGIDWEAIVVELSFSYSDSISVDFVCMSV